VLEYVNDIVKKSFNKDLLSFVKNLCFFVVPLAYDGWLLINNFWHDNLIFNTPKKYLSFLGMIECV
jgi:hypothetical protein